MFEHFEPILKDLGGRPHWGKCYSLTQNEARRLYPGSFDAFKAIRKKYDPNGVFSNEFLNQLFT